MNTLAASPADASRLVIAYAFPPYSDTSSIVAAKRVHVGGEPVDVIQNALDDLRGPDPGLEEIVDPLVRRRRAIPSRSAFSGWLSISEFCDLGMATVAAWENERGKSYANVYSRAHFVASHFLAARYVAGRPEVRWQAEFSDPMSHDAVGKLRHAPVREGELLDFCRSALAGRGFGVPHSDNVYEWCERVTYALADELWFTNAAQRDFMLGECRDRELAEAAARKAVVVPQPTLPQRFYQLSDPDYPLEPARIHIGYFGNFYASQRPRALFDALAGLDGADRDRLKLHVFTGKPEQLARFAASPGLDEAVSVRPLVPYLDFLALSTRMDVLLAIDAATPAGRKDNPFLLSKWSDYQGSGTPVWGMVAEGSELSRQQLAYRSPLDHTSAAEQVLVALARDGLTGSIRG